MKTIEVMKQALLVIAAQKAWIYTVPLNTQLPAMPGLDREWADAVELDMAKAIAAEEARLVEAMKATPDDMTIYRRTAAEPVKQPENCGSGYCSCIECLMPAKTSAAEREALIADLRILEGEQTHSTHAAWICAAADMLAADANLATNLMQVTAHRDHCLAVVDKLRAQQVAVPQGYARVPIEPTAEMVQACYAKFVPRIALPIFVAAYKAMISAAPQHPQAAPRVPMTPDKAKYMVDGVCGFSDVALVALIRDVEAHHGIGVKS